MRDSRPDRVAERKERLPELLGRGYTVEGAARALGIGERQVYKYLADDPSIRDRAAEVQEQLDPDAVSVLRELLSHSDPNIRIKAATALLRAPADEGPAAQETVTLIVRRDDSYEVLRDAEEPEPEQDDGTPEGPAADHVFDPVLAAD